MQEIELQTIFYILHTVFRVFQENNIDILSLNSKITWKTFMSAGYE